MENGWPRAVALRRPFGACPTVQWARWKPDATKRLGCRLGTTWGSWGFKRIPSPEHWIPRSSSGFKIGSVHFLGPCGGYMIFYMIFYTRDLVTRLMRLWWFVLRDLRRLGRAYVSWIMSSIWKNETQSVGFFKQTHWVRCWPLIIEYNWYIWVWVNTY